MLAGECCTTCSSGLNLNAIVTCAGAKSFGNSFAAPLVLSDCGLAGETCRIGQTFVPASKPVGAPPSTPLHTLTLLLLSGFIQPRSDSETPSGECKQFQITTTNFASINKLARVAPEGGSLEEGGGGKSLS